MEYMVVLGWILLLTLTLFYIHNRNSKLTEEIKTLKKALNTKEMNISDSLVHNATNQDSTENFSLHDETIHLISAGKSRESISKKLDIPVSRVDLIVKFNKLKKEKLSDSL